MITERQFRPSGRWAFAALGSLLIFALQAAGDAARPVLQFDRAAVLAGEGYRLLTAHWVHLDWRHAGMNAAGLWLAALIGSGRRSAGLDLASNGLRCVVLSCAVGWALYRYHPQLSWYIGLSGVLHGLFVIVLIRALLQQRNHVAFVVLSFLIGKLTWEHYHGALAQSTLDAPVIVAAHEYGALAGLAYALTGAAFCKCRAIHRPDDRAEK